VPINNNVSYTTKRTRVTPCKYSLFVLPVITITVCNLCTPGSRVYLNLYYKLFLNVVGLPFYNLWFSGTRDIALRKLNYVPTLNVITIPSHIACTPGNKVTFKYALLSLFVIIVTVYNLCTPSSRITLNMYYKKRLPLALYIIDLISYNLCLPGIRNASSYGNYVLQQLQLVLITLSHIPCTPGHNCHKPTYKYITQFYTHYNDTHVYIYQDTIKPICFSTLRWIIIVSKLERTQNHKQSISTNKTSKFIQVQILTPTHHSKYTSQLKNIPLRYKYPTITIALHSFLAIHIPKALYPKNALLLPITHVLYYLKRLKLPNSVFTNRT
jgi:hypothetical protein